MTDPLEGATSGCAGTWSKGSCLSFCSISRGQMEDLDGLRVRFALDFSASALAVRGVAAACLAKSREPCTSLSCLKMRATGIIDGRSGVAAGSSKLHAGDPRQGQAGEEAREGTEQ